LNRNRIWVRSESGERAKRKCVGIETSKECKRLFTKVILPYGKNYDLELVKEEDARVYRNNYKRSSKLFKNVQVKLILFYTHGLT